MDIISDYRLGKKDFTQNSREIRDKWGKNVCQSHNRKRGCMQNV